MKYLLDEDIQSFDYVYIISDEQGYIKVGISKNPRKRLKQLQTGNMNILKLIFTEEFECNRNHLLKIEKLIHREISHISKHMKGEWFFIEKNQITDIKDIIKFHRIRYDSDDLAFKYRKR